MITAPAHNNTAPEAASGTRTGLATLGTVTWTAVSNNIKHQAAQAAAAARASHLLPAVKAGGSPPAAVLHQALAVGISRGFLLAAAIAALALLVVITMIQARR
jgi:hypothetical protein